jgi:hypothetical protein
MYIAFQLQLQAAVYREDYRSAHKLRLAIAATAKNDTVGRAISDLNVRNIYFLMYVQLLVVNSISYLFHFLAILNHPLYITPYLKCNVGPTLQKG